MKMIYILEWFEGWPFKPYALWTFAPFSLVAWTNQLIKQQKLKQWLRELGVCRWVRVESKACAIAGHHLLVVVRSHLETHRTHGVEDVEVGKMRGGVKFIWWYTTLCTRNTHRKHRRITRKQSIQKKKNKTAPVLTWELLQKKIDILPSYCPFSYPMLSLFPHCFVFTPEILFSVFPLLLASFIFLFCSFAFSPSWFSSPPSLHQLYCFNHHLLKLQPPPWQWSHPSPHVPCYSFISKVGPHSKRDFQFFPRWSQNKRKAISFWKGLQICPSSVEFMSVRNMNISVKRKCE